MLQWVRTGLVWASLDLVMALCIYIALLFSKSVQIYHLISLLQHLSERWKPSASLYCPVGETVFSRALCLTYAPQGWLAHPCSNGSAVRVTTGGRTLLVGSPSPSTLPPPVQAVSRCPLYHLSRICPALTATTSDLAETSVSNWIP